MPRGESHIQVAGATEQGRRGNNQDVFFADGAAGLFLIADGVGSSPYGDVAAQLAAEAIRETVSASSGRQAVGDLLCAAVTHAHDHIHEQKKVRGIDKMSCALVVALLRDRTLTVANAGDSRAYLRCANGDLRQLSFDHSVANMMLSKGYITADMVPKHHLRHTLITSVGGSQKLVVAVEETTVASGDRILLCSDGVSDALDSATISAVLGGDASAQVLAERLVEAAVEASGKDNATAIVVCPGW
ncbi:MAG: PP2C family serine/threonine-protein phosphatase [Planctomycetota bacterium]